MTCKRYFAVAALLLAALPQAEGALTKEQKRSDFEQLAAIYATNYAPHNWKREALGLDVTDLRPWLSRAENSRDDLEFYDVCIEYLNTFQDGHITLTLPSDFRASLGFSVDLYEGRALVDVISRTLLPAEQYPFEIGDELISLDGRSVESWISEFSKYYSVGNPDSTRRGAAAYITVRPQIFIPRAVEVGANATVVIRRASGEQQTFTIPWVKSGTPMLQASNVLSPKTRAVAAGKATIEEAEPVDGSTPREFRALRTLQTAQIAEQHHSVRNFGARSPLFAMPTDFVQRLGRVASDTFYSGTFQSEGQRIGFIRIPSFSPASTQRALTQFLNEITYLQANTDGLVVDVMRNPGGNICYAESLISLLIPTPYRKIGFEVRGNLLWLNNFSNVLSNLLDAEAEQWQIDQVQGFYNDIKKASGEVGGRTGPLPLCSYSLDAQPLRNRSGEPIAYTKPILMLVDGFSASGGDLLPATMQDNGRVKIFGKRTMGLGGSVVDTIGTNYSEANTRVTVSLMNRRLPISTPEYPARPYVENIGVRPDIEAEYMTRENLMTNGQPFVESFTRAIVEHIRATPAP